MSAVYVKWMPWEREQAQHWHRLGLFADDEYVCTSWKENRAPYAYVYEVDGETARCIGHAGAPIPRDESTRIACEFEEGHEVE